MKTFHIWKTQRELQSTLWPASYRILQSQSTLTSSHPNFLFSNWKFTEWLIFFSFSHFLEFILDQSSDLSTIFDTHELWVESNVLYLMISNFALALHWSSFFFIEVRFGNIGIMKNMKVIQTQNFQSKISLHRW